MSEFTAGKAIPVRVALRTRPLLPYELNEGAKECLTFVQEAQQVVVNRNRAFTFDYVFDSTISQGIVYKTSVAPLIDGIFKGFNGTVIAYGQTGSGKTYSMGSAHCVSQSASDEGVGVIPRVINDLFNGIESRSKFKFCIKVSYVEIYKEELKDLLAPEQNRQSNLAIRENPDGSIRIAGLTEVTVSSPCETLEFMEQGNSIRSTGSTAMNATSSRSHAIFTISLEDLDEYTCSKFHLVDLAGSERQKRTKAQGERLQEGIKINAGLLALGNVISALGERRNADQHIPYRDSKLTRILQDSLGGNSLTVMIACVSPADCNVEETVNTLRYADRARKIKNKPMVNRDPQTAELVSLRKEVQQLRLKLLQSGASTTFSETSTPRESFADREKLNSLEEENRQLVSEMQKLVDSNTEMCEKAITTDLVCEELQGKLVELRTEAEKVANDPHDLSLAEEAISEEEQRECIHNLRNLHKKLLDVQVNGNEDSPGNIITNLTTVLHATRRDSEEGASANNSMADETGMDTSLKAEHILRTAKLSNQLQELSKALAMKEELAKRMCAGGEDMGVLKSQYEDKLLKLDKQIDSLQKEKDALATALEVAVKNNENRTISEQRRRRLLELETQIKELKREKKEKEKVSKLKAQGDQKITKLNGEIQAIKSSRVRLMRQIKEENQKFLAMKKEKEREVKQLKEKDRKRQYEIVKLERDFVKQKNVLRRKTEEAAASNRRLKEALSKQKMAAAKRQQSQSRTLDSANTKMRFWLEEDIEIAVRSKEAKRHLEGLEEDLKVLQEDLQNMENSDSPSKRRRTFVKSDADDLVRRKRELEDEVELKEAQVKDLKSKLSDAKDARTRQQTRWVQITSIAEARAIMKHLFGLIVASRMSEEECMEAKKRAIEEGNKARAVCRELENEIEQNKRDQEHSITALETTYHEQMLLLTSQLNQSSSNRTLVNPTQREANLEAQIKIQASVIEEMRKQQESEMARRDSYIGEAGDKQTFFQPLDTTFKKPTKPKIEARNYGVYESETEDDGDDDDEEISDYESESESEYEPTPKPKRTKKRTGCFCSKLHCSTKHCPCRKAGIICSDACGCDKDSCCNSESKDKTWDSNETTSSTGEKTLEDAETSENMAAPYYARKTGLFESAENSPALSPSKAPNGKNSAEVKKYKPVYFDSPLQERQQNISDMSTDEDVKSGSKPRPSVAPTKQRKRRLLEPVDFLG
uniref:Chromosome-associated kinesin KIF4A n=1 Tax=Phallusia mammillata TaxID=59560 RepID=A0A6F9DFA3_9ASCI|nr:chromosome-associated kinesin KIF4A [Phallusia mammillata]